MRTIIFGGSFDPPHQEHEKLLKAAKEQLQAQKIVLVPTYAPHYKDSASIDFSLRVKMLKAAFFHLECEIEVNEIEKIRGGTNYAADILRELKPLYENPCYLIGGDSLLNIEKWHNFKSIFKIMPIAVAERDGYPFVKEKAQELKEYGGEFLFVNFMGEDISSSTIKAKLHLGLSVPLDKKVLDIIKEEKLFNEYNGIIEKLKERQSPELFFHSIAVVLRAVDLNSKHSLNLDFDEVFLSALLHDNSKEMLDAGGYDVPKDSIGSPVLHQFLGAKRAERDFKIKNKNILSAIECHTTAKPKMSTLEKLIFAADMLSEDRDFDGLDLLLKVTYSNFDEGFKACLEHSYNYVLSKGKVMYPLTDLAYKYYFNDNGDK